jgi:Putative auto-transporter adhesin, head GIN domain
MRNTLEKYIHDHRNELDVLEPSARVWAGINSRIHTKSSFIKSHIAWLKYFGFSISIIAALVYLKNQSDPVPSVSQTRILPPARSNPQILPDHITLFPEKKILSSKQTLKTPLAASSPEKTAVDSSANLTLTDTARSKYLSTQLASEKENNHSSNQTTMNSNTLKKALLVSAIAFDSLSFINAQVAESKNDKNTITQERQITPFTEISISGIGDVFISQGDKEKVTVSASEKSQPLIEVINEGNTLIIRRKNEANFKGGATINITLRDISKLSVSGIGKIRTTSLLKLQDLECTISAMGNLELELQCNNLKAKISSIGDLSLKGSAAVADIVLSGMGNFHALDFEIGTLTAKMSGMGNAEVYAKESIDIKASGMGNLRYKGNPPHETIKTSGMGSVNKI